MNIAAIDIGSNGARLLIKSFDDNAPESSRIRKLLFIRIPLRLGKDVFALGKISKERQRMMMHMMKGFSEFMQLYNVEHFRACATSAMRDAENGKKVMRRIEKATGIRLGRNLASGNFLETIELSKKFSMVEIEVPKKWIGKTIRELNLRSKGINIIARKGDLEDLVLIVDPDSVIQGSETFIIIGSNKDLERELL